MSVFTTLNNSTLAAVSGLLLQPFGLLGLFWES
jgi:hypothetical protein